MRFPVLTMMAAGALIAGRQGAWAQAPDFNREVRPILSQHCFKCHGPDDGQRMVGLRLDKREGAMLLLSSKHRAVVPGKPQESTLVKRTVSKGADKMPPDYANKPLSDKEKETLRRWIATGADYKPHWAFVPPKAAPLPHVQNTAWPRNPIDTFTLARMEKEGLQPSPPADRYTLVRRVYLDLIGLPPTVQETDQFINDKSKDAYEKLIDRLLTSPHYGERWGRRWLDLARYADTNGYEKDRPRSVWPYRDWVINALNNDMPFDQFTIEQLAGDMLPNASISQKIATGFHRNTMLNEEGGIDPLEYRFYSMVDRVATTGTAWLGLTVGCAQCHTHKFDPITQREYYRTMAFLNNADELMTDVPDSRVDADRRAAQAKIAAREMNLAANFPPEDDSRWLPIGQPTVTTVSGAKSERLPDNSVRLSGTIPDTDTYTVTADTDGGDISSIRLETLTDPSLGGNGPGRTPHGNFVLTGFTASLAPANAPDKATPIKFVRAEADFTQDGFLAQQVLDGNPKTGWAIHGPGNWNVARHITFMPEKPLHLAKGDRLTFYLEQNYGGSHTIGRFRITLGQISQDSRSLEIRRRENLDRKYNAWLKTQEASAAHWQTLRPIKAISNLPLLTVQDDNSVFVSGDMTKRDVYDLTFRTDGKPITAIRLEALPDDRLPKHGPGRVFYEGGLGDFFLSEFTMKAGGKAIPFAGAVQNGGSAAQAAVDGDALTGWSVGGRAGETTIAVFRLPASLTTDTFSLQMVFERYYAAALGRFRISVTSDTPPASAALSPDIENILLTAAPQRTEAQKAQLLRSYLAVAPELQAEREAIAKMKSDMPEFPTALIFSERPSSNPRPTFVHHRGEFLSTKEQVTPGVLAVLPGLPASAPPNRLTFARWLVSPENPLVSRVAVNRQWAAFFGRGLVRTTEDFGYQGDSPTHPELLDWLAVNFAGKVDKNKALSSSFACGWSLKKLHRLIVMSATYRQASRVTPTLLAHDPENRLLARGPRVRLEAEMVRDSALTASGLLSRKIGGPSVFPPQPPGVTSEGTYGPLAWNVSEGEDRYRRGLYTFSKRTAPYAMFNTFDAPTGEVCVARREVSNTPLQALTLLNDQVFTEASQALGTQIAALSGTDEERLIVLFRHCLTRPPTKNEIDLFLKFYTAQKTRFEMKELDAAVIAGPGEGDVNARAAWTVAARSLLNLDESVTKR